MFPKGEARRVVRIAGDLGVHHAALHRVRVDGPHRAREYIVALRHDGRRGVVRVANFPITQHKRTSRWASDVVITDLSGEDGVVTAESALLPIAEWMGTERTAVLRTQYNHAGAFDEREAIRKDWIAAVADDIARAPQEANRIVGFYSKHFREAVAQCLVRSQGVVAILGGDYGMFGRDIRRACEDAIAGEVAGPAHAEPFGPEALAAATYDTLLPYPLSLRCDQSFIAARAAARDLGFKAYYGKLDDDVTTGLPDIVTGLRLDDRALLAALVAWRLGPEASVHRLWGWVSALQHRLYLRREAGGDISEALIEPYRTGLAIRADMARVRTGDVIRIPLSAAD